ncbi:hypothetical protein C8T65DRAFT_780152 [Cerioporus squamosus]|nr:hypothetical protein C8T65DRAFT_780152 [Cerioporus squamosus]
MSTLFVRYISSLVYVVVTAGIPLDVPCLVLLVILWSCNVLEAYGLASPVYRCMQQLSGILRNSPLISTVISLTPAKTVSPTRPKPYPKASRVSRTVKPQPPANLTVQVDRDAFHKLTQEHLQLHLQVKASKHNSATLRSRIWFLEDANEALRADITSRARDQEQLAGEKTALLGEKEALVRERDWIAGDRDRAVGENDALRTDLELLKSSKDGLVADVEDLEAQNEDLMDGKEALLTEKMAAEEKLARESARRRQAETQAKALQHERDALASQLASKQETLNDLMDESEVLEDELQATKRSLTDTERNLATLQTIHDGVLQELTTLKTKHNGALEAITELKAELETLLKSTSPICEVATLRAEFDTTKHSLIQFQQQHEQQSGALELCRATLHSTSDERDSLRDSLDALRARHHLAEDLEDTLLRTLEERDVEISQLEATLAGRDATIAAHETTLADQDATICTHEAALVERDIALADRDAALAQADAALAECEASFAERDATAASQDRKLVDLQTYVAGLEGVVRFLKLDASAAHLPVTPVKSAPRSHSTPTPPLSSSASPSRSFFCRITSNASSSTENIRMPSTPALPAPLMLPSRSSSPSSSPTGSPGSNMASPRRSWFF